MSKQRQNSTGRESRLTPWVGRIMLANATVLVLLSTVLTAPGFFDALQFDPHLALRRPWTFFSYLFVHGGVFHLGGNLLLLFVFGPPVERRLGGRAFLLYYLYCGVGAAAFTLGLSSFMAVPPLVGATGAGLGTALAFAFAWPDADAVLTPLPIRVSARALVLLLASADLILALWAPDGAAQLGYLGGLAAGYVFFRVQSLAARRQRKGPKSIAHRPVMAPIPVRQGGTLTEVRPARARPEPREEYPADEVDRVLDKISAFGIQSLTADERRFLDDVSKRKRKDLH
jgi:membrane associated rhomboid family serine protease